MCRRLGIIDTNVVVSYFLFHDSVAGEIIDMALDGTFIPILNGHILREYLEVLSRESFKLDKNIIDLFITNLALKAKFVQPAQTKTVFKDADDKVFYDTLLAASKFGDSYLITGNKKDFPEELNIISPREMLEIIDGTLYRHD